MENDESIPENKRKYIIKTRPERSQQLELWIRMLDKLRKQTDEMLGKRKKERIRVLPSVPQPTLFPALPTNMPIDYFNPDFFNIQQPTTRRRMAGPGKSVTVALLPDVTQSFTHSKLERLTDEEFLMQLGDEILKKYDLSYDEVIDAHSYDQELEEENNEAEEFPEVDVGLESRSEYYDMEDNSSRGSGNRENREALSESSDSDEEIRERQRALAQRLGEGQVF
jgi:hypothetical protein